MSRLILSLAFAVLGLGCAPDPDVQDPGDTVRRFLDAMDRSGNDPAALQEAFVLLDAASRAELRARARKAETLAGHGYEPWEMLVQGRFRLRFAPRRSGGLKATVHGDSARVVAQGARPAERAEIPLVLEDGHWRLRLDLQPARTPDDPPAP